MPDNDNVAVEKISLNSSDFADDLQDNSFGIQDTQVLASKDLNSFLLGDPNKVTTVEPPANQQAQQQQPKPEEKIIPGDDAARKAFEEKQKKEVEGQKALDDLLFNDSKKDEGKGGEPITDPALAQQSADDDTYATLAKDFLRLGVFSKNSDDETEENIAIKTPEEFLERMSLEKKKGAINILDGFLSQFGEDRRRMFDALFVNGVEPQEYLSSFVKQEALGKLDMTVESNQERVVRSYLKSINYDESKLEGKIQKMKDYGDLEDEANTYHKILIEKEAKVGAELEKKKADERQAQITKEAELKKSYNRILQEKLKATEIDGIPINEKEVQSTLDYLTEKKYKLESGELLSEYDKDILELNRPENHELKVKLGVLLRKKLDLSSVKKNSVSKKSDQLFTLTAKNAKQTAQQQQPKSFF